MSEQCFCLRWTNYQSNVVGDLRSLLEQEEFVDVTLACDGRRIKAHRLMLSACSNYFFNLLKENLNEHPIILLKDVKFWELESILEFIYNGQVNVMQDRLPGFIRTAESLQIKGLAAVNNTCFNSTKTYSPKVNDSFVKHKEKWQDFSKQRLPYREPEFNKSIPYLQPSKKIRLENGIAAINNHHVEKKNTKSASPPNGKSPPQQNSNDVNDCKKKPPFKNLMNHEELCETVIGQDRLNAKEEVNETLDDKNSSVIDGLSSSRSGSPEEERLEMEEDPFSREGSTTSNDGLKEGEWSIANDHHSNNLGIDVNDAGLPICKVCGKVFKHQGSLVAHYQVHQQRTKCPVCKKVLSRHYHMKVHLLTVHKVPDSEIEGLLRSQNIA